MSDTWKDKQDGKCERAFRQYYNKTTQWIQWWPLMAKYIHNRHYCIHKIKEEEVRLDDLPIRLTYKKYRCHGVAEKLVVPKRIDYHHKGYVKRPKKHFNTHFYKPSRQKIKQQLLKTDDVICWDVNRKPHVYWD